MKGSSEIQRSPNDLPQEQRRITIELLQLVQGDYQQARKQLEEVCHTFSEREARTHEYFRFAAESLKPSSNQLSMDKSMRLQVYCLGQFEVWVSGEKVDQWHGSKAKSILKYLVARAGRLVRKEILMETLWPNSPPDLANANLKAAVHALRQTLRPPGSEGSSSPYVLSVQGSYLINPEVALWTDVKEFEHHWIVGRRLEREGKPDASTREYKLAEALYRGDYLEEDPYEEWTLLQREALKDTYLTILSKLADYLMSAADYEGCIFYSQKMLVKDCCCENAYRRLMYSYSQLGQRSRALQWYNLCEKTIKAELDVSPDSQITALYHKLLNDEHL